MAQKSTQKGTAFILYVPGGGVRGLIPIKVLTHIEELMLGTPTMHSFQSSGGSSVGGLVVASLNIRKPDDPTQPLYKARQVLEAFPQEASRFFSPVPLRVPKMLTRDACDVLVDIMDPGRQTMYQALLASIAQKIDVIDSQVPDAETELKRLVAELREKATSPWLSKSLQRSAMQLADHLAERKPELKKMAGDLNEYISSRPIPSLLERAFRRAVLAAAKLGHTWAGASKGLYDPVIPMQILTEKFGNAKLSDCLRSMQIPALNVTDRKKEIFSAARQDIFSLSPETPCKTSDPDLTLVDVVMAGMANELVYPPYVAANDKAYKDMAPFDSPVELVENTVRACGNNGTKVKLVIIDTGEFAHGENSVEPPRDNGFFYNFYKGKTIDEIKKYTQDGARPRLHELIGKDNILYLSPRRTARTYEEMRRLPDSDVSNASPENMARLEEAAAEFIAEQDDVIRGLCRELTENLLLTGMIDRQRYREIICNIDGVSPATCDVHSQNGYRHTGITGVATRVVSGLKETFLGPSQMQPHESCPRCQTVPAAPPAKLEKM